MGVFFRDLYSRAGSRCAYHGAARRSTLQQAAFAEGRVHRELRRARRQAHRERHAADGEAGRMRWDYSSPEGKLFLLDGKFATMPRAIRMCSGLKARTWTICVRRYAFCWATQPEEEFNQLTLEARCQWRVHTERRAEGPGKPDRAGDAVGAGGWRDYRDRDRRDRWRDDASRLPMRL